jgi:hypothetical protein
MIISVERNFPIKFTSHSTNFTLNSQQAAATTIYSSVSGTGEIKFRDALRD